MPGMEPTSKQLHDVLTLSAGMGGEDVENSPVTKLKEALSSPQAFQSYYLVSHHTIPPKYLFKSFSSFAVQNTVIKKFDMP